jgi:hypothetical protein
LWHHFPLCESEEVGARRLPEMKMVDDCCWHLSDATARPDRPPSSLSNGVTGHSLAFAPGVPLLAAMACH